jgi:hypothetical protein
MLSRCLNYTTVLRCDRGGMATVGSLHVISNSYALRSKAEDVRENVNLIFVDLAA